MQEEELRGEEGKGEDGKGKDVLSMTCLVDLVNRDGGEEKENIVAPEPRNKKQKLEQTNIFAELGNAKPKVQNAVLQTWHEISYLKASKIIVFFHRLID